MELREHEVRAVFAEDEEFFDRAVLAVLTGCAKTLQPDLERTLVESAYRVAEHAVAMRRERRA